MRRRQQGMVRRLKELQAMELSRDPTPAQTGRAQQQFPGRLAFGRRAVPEAGQQPMRRTSLSSCALTSYARCAAGRDAT